MDRYELVPRAERGSGILSCLLARAEKKLAFLGASALFSQNEKELLEVIQRQSEKILGQIDKSGQLIVRSS